MADKSGDHLLNHGPLNSATKRESSRETRRAQARADRMKKRALGRDEQFQNDFQPKGRRLRDDNK
ncbi:hypothetical protein CH249_14275 [Rhodococcus sp. 05-2255-3B1]|nr:hypothetical protein CH249_14275 [Rhodococcus sp. 05-2255-3B1]OZE13587.1 hypothetical protein CH250_06860 [Rhodococcus sp. 05-2255-3C]OZE23867.1 hypothetical protein CH255_03600 [Rhodococcus sp. 05-2255-2A2]